MKTLLLSLLLVGCVVDTGDEELETTESEVQYCPDDECEPYTPVARPDLTAGGDTTCHIMASPTGYKLLLRVRNVGNDRASSTTARVSFTGTQSGVAGTPVNVGVPGLDAG